MTKNSKILNQIMKYSIFFLSPLWRAKLKEKLPVPQKEHLALQNMKYLNFWESFLSSESGSRSGFPFWIRFSINRPNWIRIQIRNPALMRWTVLFGTDPERNGVLEETPRSWADSYRWLSHLGVREPYATRCKRRYEANQVWLNTTFISQGSQSWGKLAVETWRVKT